MFTPGLNDDYERSQPSSHTKRPGSPRSALSYQVNEIALLGGIWLRLQTFNHGGIWDFFGGGGWGIQRSQWYTNNNRANKCRLISPKDNGSQVSGAINIAAQALAAHSLLFGILSWVISSSGGNVRWESPRSGSCVQAVREEDEASGPEVSEDMDTSVHHWYHMLLYWQHWLNPSIWANTITAHVKRHYSDI